MWAWAARPWVSRFRLETAGLVVLLEFVLCMVSMAGWMRPSVCQDSGASAEKSVRLGASHWEITESLLSPHGDWGMTTCHWAQNIQMCRPSRTTVRLAALRAPKSGPTRPAVAVGMPVARHPPHRSVRALLTHTVLTLDVLPRKANVRIRMQNFDVRDEAPEFLPKFVPGPAGSLTPPPKLPPPHA